MRRIVIVILITFIAMGSIFGATSSRFSLRHVVNVESSYHFEFWNPTTNSMIANTSVEGSTRTTIATLMIIYNSTASIKSITMTFSPMTNTSDASETISYKMEILEPSTSTAKVSAFNVTNASKSVGILSGVTNYTKYSSSMWDTDEVADFAITLNNPESAAPGSYEATITCTFTAN